MTTMEAYRRNGAILEMDERDASVLVSMGIGIREPMFDSEWLVAVRIPGIRIDRHVPGEAPVLVLTGGMEVSRGDGGDRVSVIRTLGLP